MAALYPHTTRSTGTTLTAAIYNADHENHITNGIPAQLDDYSASVAQMQSTANPGGVGSESQATSLAGEIERLRYVIKTVHAGAQWYPGVSLNPGTAKGDVIAYSASGTPARVAVGANGRLLGADSAQTAGVVWMAHGNTGVQLNTLYAVPFDYIAGLVLSNNGTDAANDIDIAAGEASDGTNAKLMRLASALTKRLDATWAVGTNQGMLDGSESVAGTPDTATWYFIWLIMRSDTGVVDVLASESSTAPTMPTNYDYKRLIGAVYNDSGGDIDPFYYAGNGWFVWKSAVNVLNAGTATTETAITSSLAPAVPSIAQAYSANVRSTITVATGNTGTNSVDLYLASTVVFTAGAYTSGTGESTTIAASAQSGDMVLPYTGYLAYLNNQSLTATRSATINVLGWKMNRT